MKIKPTRSPGGVVVELGPNEREFPGAGTEPRQTPAPAFNLKRILVPIDFSPCANKALQYAIPLAKQFGAKLCLVYVAEGYYVAGELGPFDLSEVETQARADAAAKLAALATKQIAASIPVDLFVRQGHRPTEIINAATQLDADLIIISTHGYRGLKHAWFGSVTEDVVRHTHCPVLVVREEEHEFLV